MFGLGRWLAICILTVSASGGAFSQEQPQTPELPQIAPPIIIVMDFERVVRQSAAAQGIQSQIDAERAVLQQEFTEIEQRLRAMESALETDRQSLTGEELAQRREEFEEQVVAAQRAAQTRRAVLDSALQGAMEQVRSTLVDVVANLTNEIGANLVLNQDQMILADRSLDVSELALARLNQRLPALDLRLPERE